MDPSQQNERIELIAALVHGLEVRVSAFGVLHFEWCTADRAEVTAAQIL